MNDVLLISINQVQSAKMKKNIDEIKIGIGRFKAISQIFIVIGLLGLTIWFLTTKVIYMTSASNKTFLLVCCSILILVFGLATISGIRNLINIKTGLIINQNGIKINIGPNSGQLINWDEIKGFKIHNPIRGPIFLLIFIKNPDDLISKTYGFKRFFIKMNNVSHGTPVSLTSNWLEYDFEELIDLINDEYKKYGAQQKNIVHLADSAKNKDGGNK